jgi:hypothetical protein
MAAAAANGLLHLKSGGARRYLLTQCPKPPHSPPLPSLQLQPSLSS